MSTWLRLTLVTMTVGGGFTGVAITVQGWQPAREVGGGTTAVLAAFLVLYAFVLASGLLLVHDPRRTRPVAAALALQVPMVSSPVITYQLTAGLHATVSVGEAGLQRMGL